MTRRGGRPCPARLARYRNRDDAVDRSSRSESEAMMTVLTKAQALGVIRRAYGPDRAESLADRLPERIDLGNPTDHELLFELGLTREQLFEALGAEW